MGVARRVLDGLERGDVEVLIDESSSTAKKALSGPVAGLVLGG